MKKVLFIILAALCAVSTFAQTVKADWLLDEKGLEKLAAEMNKYPDKTITVDISKCKVPENKHGFKSIPTETFSRRNNIKKIIFSKDADYIAYRQFSYCESLTEIVLPQKVRGISNLVFSGCKSLKKIVLPQIVEDGEISVSDFYNCEALEEIVMPKNLKWISCQANREKAFTHLKKMVLSSYPVNILSDASPSAGAYFGSDDYTFQVVTPAGTKKYNEFYKDCYDYSVKLRPKEIGFSSIKSSSNLSDKYKAENIFSGDWQCWAEGAKGNGVGEWIEVQFSEPTTVYMISLKNGFGNLSYFWKNNRIKDCELIFDDDSSNPVKLALDDTPECQNFYIHKNDKTYSKMRLVIKSVYPGTDPDNDTCLDELAVNMTFLRASEMEWDVYYSTNSKGYVYDPETARMLKEVFVMDVGEKKTGTTKDGRVTVKAKDWEMDTEYATVIPGALSGTLFSDFWPGTGGGHRYHKYKILLQENGNHILIEWLNYGDGVAAKLSLDGLFIWKDKKWVSYKDSSIKSADYGIEPLVNLINWFESKGIEYDCFCTEDTIVARPRIIESYDRNVSNFEFEYDTKGIRDYKKEPANIIVKGSADELKAIADWEKELPNFYKNANILVVAAAFNPDPSMTKYLIEKGYGVNVPYEKETYREPLTPLQACVYYKNNSVLQTLLDNGAGYSPSILVDAMKKKDLAEVEKYCDLVTSYDEALKYVLRIYYDGEKNRKETLAYIKKLIEVFKKHGFDIDKYVGENRKGEKELHSICGDAIYTMDLDYIKLCIDSGCKMPCQIEAYGDPTPVEHAVHEWLSGSDEEQGIAEKRKKHMEVIEYLLAHGGSVNAPQDKKEWFTSLHEICDTDYFQQSRIDMAKYLIKKGIDVNQKDSRGQTALSYFVHQNRGKLNRNYQSQILTLLLENGAVTGEELFEIRYSKDEFNKDLFDRLFASMKDVNYVSTSERRTLLTYLMNYPLQDSTYYALKQILSRDFNMYSKTAEETYNNRKQTPFCDFVNKATGSKLSDDKILELYELLIKHGGDVNEVSEYRYGPLPVACNLFYENYGRSLLLMKKLLGDGAKLPAKLKDGKTCAELILMNFYFEDENHPENNEDFWTDLTPEETDTIVEAARLLISHGDKITAKKMKKLHVPQDIIKRITAKK